MLVLFFVVIGCYCGIKGKNLDEGLLVEQFYDKSYKLMEGGNWSGVEVSFCCLVVQYFYGLYIEQVMIELVYVQYKVGKYDDVVFSIDCFICIYLIYCNIVYLYYFCGLVNGNCDMVFLCWVWFLDLSCCDLFVLCQVYVDFIIVIECYFNSCYVVDVCQCMIVLCDVFVQYELDNVLYYLCCQVWVLVVGCVNYLLEIYLQSVFQYDVVVILVEVYMYLDNKLLVDDVCCVFELNQFDYLWLQGKWLKYLWMVCKLNLFVGEKLVSIGQCNVMINCK